MSQAELDLPFYFGSGSRTRAGCAGIETSFGQMLERAASSRPSDDAKYDSRRLKPEARERLKRWMQQPKTDSTMNVSRLEDELLRRIAHGGEADAQRIESRLATLSTVQVRALQLHYAGSILSEIVDPCAVMVQSAKKLCNKVGEVPCSELRTALLKAKPLVRDQIEGDARVLFEGARDAYDSASEIRGRRAQVDDPREWKR